MFSQGDITIHDPVADVIEVHSQRLFGPRAGHLRREFVQRILRIWQVQSVQVRPKRSKAIIRISRDRTGLAALLEQAARELESNRLVQEPTLQHVFLGDSTVDWDVFRYGETVSSWQIVHELPDRIRLRHTALLQHSNLARFLERELNTQAGIRQATVNPGTGGLLIHFDAATTGRDQLLELLEGLVRQGNEDSTCASGSRAKCDSIESAQIVAYLRGLGAREPGSELRNPDYLAKQFLNPKWRWLLRFPLSLSRWYVELAHPGIYPFIHARTRHFDATLAGEIRAGIQQYVILGSGYDTRPYRFSRELAHIRVFELDFPGTLARKKEKLCRLFGQLPDHVTYVPIDFNTQSIEEALAGSGYDERSQTFFSWEGVSYYLRRTAVRDVLAFVKERSGTGSSIAFDYATSWFVEGVHRGYGARELAQWSETASEPYLFGLDGDEMARLLRGSGFAICSDIGPHELAAKYLMSQGEGSAPQVNAVFRIVVAETGDRPDRRHVI